MRTLRSFALVLGILVMLGSSQVFAQSETLKDVRIDLPSVNFTGDKVSARVGETVRFTWHIDAHTKDAIKRVTLILTDGDGRPLADIISFENTAISEYAWTVPPQLHRSVNPSPDDVDFTLGKFHGKVRLKLSSDVGSLSTGSTLHDGDFRIECAPQNRRPVIHEVRVNDVEVTRHEAIHVSTGAVHIQVSASDPDEDPVTIRVVELDRPGGTATRSIDGEQPSPWTYDDTLPVKELDSTCLYGIEVRDNRGLSTQAEFMVVVRGKGSRPAPSPKLRPDPLADPAPKPVDPNPPAAVGSGTVLVLLSDKVEGGKKATLQWASSGLKAPVTAAVSLTPPEGFKVDVAPTTSASVLLPTFPVTGADQIYKVQLLVSGSDGGSTAWVGSLTVTATQAITVTAAAPPKPAVAPPASVAAAPPAPPKVIEGKGGELTEEFRPVLEPGLVQDGTIHVPPTYDFGYGPDGKLGLKPREPKAAAPPPK